MKNYADNWAKHFDVHTTLLLHLASPKITPHVTKWIEDRDAQAFVMAIAHLMIIVVVATMLYKLCKYLPLALYVGLFLTSHTQCTVYLILIGYWIFSKFWFRQVTNSEPVKQGSGVPDIYYRPYDMVKPMEKKEREVFTKCLPLVEMVILFAVGAAILAYGDKSIFPFLSVLIVIIIARCIPSVGGNSTAGVITILMVLCFSIMMVGPHMYAQWSEVLGWDEPPSERGPIIREDLTAQGWMMWETVTNSLFNTIGLALNYAKLGDVMRCFLGIFCLAFLMIDEWFGPGAGLMAMIRVRVRNAENHQFGIAGIFKSLNWLGLLVELGFCFVSSNYTKLAVGIIAIIAAGFMWYLIGAWIWKGRGMAATQVEARTDTMIILGDGPTGFRRMFCIAIAVANLSAYFMVNGAANGFGLLVLLMIPACNSERALALYIGFVTANMTLITMGATSRKPINERLTEAAQPAADPTFGANSGGMSGEPPPI